MLQGQLSFDEILLPDRPGPGRPRTLRSWAKEQREAAGRSRRAARKVLAEAAVKEDYRRKRKKWDAKRYKRCPEKVKAAAKKSYRKYFVARAKSAAERYRRDALRGMLYRAEKRAKERGFGFDLTLDDIAIPELCPVLGIPLKIREDGKAGVVDSSPTLDRIDNSRGYVRGNVCVISWRANRMKCDASLAEMEKVVAYMRGANG